MRSGWLKAEDLAAAEGDTQWRPLSEVVQSNEIPEIPVEDKQNVSGSSNHLKVSRGLGVAAICLLLLTLLLWTLSSGVGLWAELKLREGIYDYEEINETVRLWRRIIIPFGLLSFTGANICLVCADRSYVTNVLLGLLLGFVVLRLLFGVSRYLLNFPLRDWLVENFSDNLGLIYWLFFAAAWVLFCLWSGLFMIQRKNGYRIVLLMGLIIYSAWEITILASWGSAVLPDSLRELLGFMRPVNEWLGEHGPLRAMLFWLFGLLIPMLAWFVMAVPLAFGKSTRPEPEN